MRKLGFPLVVSDNWPPYDVEHMWVEESETLFQVKNFPFFLKGVAYDDLLRVQYDQDGYVTDWDIVVPSGNSTIWVIENQPTDIVDQLVAIGCGAEREESHDLISVNVPQSVDRDRLDSVLSEYEGAKSISVAVPVDRIGLLP